VYIIKLFHLTSKTKLDNLILNKTKNIINREQGVKKAIIRRQIIRQILWLN